MINVVGLGYIGLPTALMFAAHGVEVTGTDYNRTLVDTLNAGKTTFEEDGLDELFRKAVAGGIRFSHEYERMRALWKKPWNMCWTRVPKEPRSWWNPPCLPEPLTNTSARL